MNMGAIVADRPSVRGRFSTDELGILWALQIPGVRISLERGDRGTDIAVLRPCRAPDAIAATLAKGTGTVCLLTCYQAGRDGNEPDVEAAFPSFAMAVFALGAVFAG